MKYILDSQLELLSAKLLHDILPNIDLASHAVVILVLGGIRMSYRYL